MKHTPRLLAAALTLAMLGGCTYYRVTDPDSGRVYYTNNWMAGRYGYSGAVQFKDALTGANVTLSSSEVQEITKDEYDSPVGYGY